MGFRTTDQIENIKKYQSDPFQIMDILSDTEVHDLLCQYAKSDKKKKVTNPTVSAISANNKIISKVVNFLKPQIGNFDVRSAFFFDVTSPHVLHVDDSFEYPQSHKGILLPLWHDGYNDPHFFVFNQHYYQGPSKFFKNRKTSVKVHYNKPVYEYSDIEDLDDVGINDYHKSMLTHLDPEWLDGLSVNTCFPWTIGSAIVFDSLQIHCASNFIAEGVTNKIAISIFTKVET